MDRKTLGRVAAVVAAVALAPLVLYFVPGLVGGSASYVVLSGSMSPTFRAGDFIVDRGFAPGDPLQVGDVITYRNGPSREAPLVTHRVIGIEGPPGQRLVRTQGDANPSPDPAPQPEGRIVGVYITHVPGYGQLAALPSQPMGKLVFIVLPCAAVFVLELRKLFKRVVAAEALRQAVTAGATGPTVAASAAPPAPSPRPAPGPHALAPPSPAQVLRRAPASRNPPAPAPPVVLRRGPPRTLSTPGGASGVRP